MRKVYSLFILLVLLAGVWAAKAPQGYAQGVQTPTPTPLVVLGGQDVLSFSMLNETDIVMRGPFDSATVQFAPPASWELQNNASLALAIDASLSSQDLPVGQTPSASLAVWLNDELIDTVFIDWSGLRTINIEIPAVALLSARTDGRQVLDFELDASMDCRYIHETAVVIDASSAFYLPHAVVAPKTNLALLPKPIFQKYAFQVEPAFLIVPENPTAGELKAAMAVAAGFGRMSSGDLNLPLVPLNLLTNEQKLNSHLVFVGKASSLQILSAVRFPVVVTPQGLVSPSSQPDDGYVQMGISPWNSARVILLASGNTDAGVIKAAQAVSTGLIQPGTEENLAVISRVNSIVQVPPVSEDSTLANMGYPTRTISGYGTATLDYSFYISPGQIAGEGAYFNFVYTHSALLDFNTSSFVVSVNNQRVGSQRFTVETAAQTNTLKINLSPTVMRSGENKLSVEVELLPVNFCSQTTTDNLWFTVGDSSLLHLPLIPASVNSFTGLISLNQYRIPFLNSPTLDTVGFVLPSSDPGAWKIAAALAADFGLSSSGLVLAPEVVFADAAADEFLQNHDLIIVGRPSKLPLVAMMANAMPAPFEANSDQASERNMAITYRLEPNASLGYIELFASPYNDKHVVLTVLGSTADGLSWSGDALVIADLRSKLDGNYAVVNKNQILTTDTRIGLGPNLSATAVPGALPTVVMPSLAAPVVAIGRPGWVLPAITVISILILVLLIVVIAIARNQNRAAKR